MAKKSFRLKNGVLKLKPVTEPSGMIVGEFYVNPTTGSLNYNDGANTSEIVTPSAEQTLENKTFTTPVISNPTGLTNADVGLGNVDNTSDINKTISDDTQTALNNKQPLASRLTQITNLTPTDDDIIQQSGAAIISSSVATVKADMGLVKVDVGLGNVDNTSDATQNAAIATLTNKTLKESVADNYLDFNKESEPSSPAAGKIRFYAGTDNEFYQKTSDGDNFKIGTLGDGITVEFNPFFDFSQNYLQGTATNQVYAQPRGQFNWASPTKLANPSVIPPAWAIGAGWSPNGEFLAVAHQTTPFVTVYQRSGTTFTKLVGGGGQFSSTLPTGSGNSAEWSPSGEFLAVAHGTTPFISIYQQSGTTFTKLTDPAILPTGNGQCLAWSPNGEFLAIGHSTTPFITVYQRSGTTFTKLVGGGGQFSSTLPTNVGTGIAWSPDGQFLCYAHNGSPYITIYQVSGTTFTKVTNPSNLPTATAIECEWSPDGQFLVVTYSAAPGMIIYQQSGTTFTKVTNPAIMPNGTIAQGIAWSPNSKFLAIGQELTPFILIYQRSGTTFTKLTDPASLPVSSGDSLTWSSNGEFLITTHNGTPFIAMYQTNDNMPTEGLLKLTRKEKSF